VGIRLMGIIDQCWPLVHASNDEQSIDGAPPWLRGLLAWKKATKKSSACCRELFGEGVAPNLADVGSKESLALAGAVFDALEVPRAAVASISDEDGNVVEPCAGNSLERAL